MPIFLSLLHLLFHFPVGFLIQSTCLTFQFTSSVSQVKNFICDPRFLFFLSPPRTSSTVLLYPSLMLLRSESMSSNTLRAARFPLTCASNTSAVSSSFSLSRLKRIRGLKALLDSSLSLKDASYVSALETCQCFANARLKALRCQDEVRVVVHQVTGLMPCHSSGKLL